MHGPAGKDDNMCVRLLEMKEPQPFRTCHGATLSHVRFESADSSRRRARDPIEPTKVLLVLENVHIVGCERRGRRHR